MHQRFALRFMSMLQCIAGVLSSRRLALERYLTPSLHFRAIGQAGAEAKIDPGGCRRTPRRRAKRDRVVVLHTIFSEYSFGSGARLFPFLLLAEWVPALIPARELGFF